MLCNVACADEITLKPSEIGSGFAISINGIGSSSPLPFIPKFDVKVEVKLFFCHDSTIFSAFLPRRRASMKQFQASFLNIFHNCPSNRCSLLTSDRASIWLCGNFSSHIQSIAARLMSRPKTNQKSAKLKRFSLFPSLLSSHNKLVTLYGIALSFF